MENPTGTQVNYYHVCHRKLWLFSKGIELEYHSESVKEGKIIAETTYPQRADKYRELDLGFIKIDHYDPKNRIVHEVKKSNKTKDAHLAQLKYYLWVLENLGIEGVSGILEYPLMKRTERVNLTDSDRSAVTDWMEGIAKVLEGNCPAVVKLPICKGCAHFDFCFA